ncbi:hypothetical protein HDU86_007972 [Geranomyces michiganensis]|nr:hypothetical protein HDU86_007972 [Geranomyces michiganensis]
MPKRQNEVRTTLRLTRPGDPPLDSNKADPTASRVQLRNVVVKKGLGGVAQHLQEEIRIVANIMTGIAFEASRLVNLFVLHALTIETPLPNMSYGRFMRQPFALISRGNHPVNTNIAPNQHLDDTYRILYN